MVVEKGRKLTSAMARALTAPRGRPRMRLTLLRAAASILRASVDVKGRTAVR
jgi:hypothetical protein